MIPTDIDTYAYSHVHFAFANITHDFKVSVDGARDEFERFKTLRRTQTIISIGGWALSKEAPPYSLFNDDITSADRETLAKNVASFIVSNQGLVFKGQNLH